jgi:ferredoxin-type protein NapG
LLASGFKAFTELALRTAGAYLAGYEEALPPPAPVVRTRIRPPGSVAEPAFRSACTSCGDCSAACPYEAIKPGEDGLPWLWDPAGHPCYMCDGFPCIGACATGALIYTDRRLRTIGLAEIAPDRCLAYQGEACTACKDACRDARAIRTELPPPGEGKRAALPVVDSKRCTGCGICVGRCPAPELAISLRPGS